MRQRHPDALVAQWAERLAAGETSTQIAAEYDGVTRGALLGAVDRYRRKQNGPPEGAPQYRGRPERPPAQIITDKQRAELYAGRRYDGIA